MSNLAKTIEYQETLSLEEFRKVRNEWFALLPGRIEKVYCFEDKKILIVLLDETLTLDDLMQIRSQVLEMEELLFEKKLLQIPSEATDIRGDKSFVVIKVNKSKKAALISKMQALGYKLVPQ